MNQKNNDADAYFEQHKSIDDLVGIRMKGCT